VSTVLVTEFTHKPLVIVDTNNMAEAGPTALGKLVRDARKRLGYSQADLAREMSLRGFDITREAIASIEAGNVDLPSKETVRGFSAVLGLSRARQLEAAEWLDPPDADRQALVEELRAERQMMTEIVQRVDRILGRLEPEPDRADRSSFPADESPPQQRL